MKPRYVIALLAATFGTQTNRIEIGHQEVALHIPKSPPAIHAVSSNNHMHAIVAMQPTMQALPKSQRFVF